MKKILPIFFAIMLLAPSVFAQFGTGPFGDVSGGAVEVNNLETTTEDIATNEIPVGTSADTSTYKAVPDCNVAGSALNYEDSTQTFSCRAGLGGGSIDTTTVDDTTWSDGVNAANTWTFDVSGTDHTMIFGNGLVTFSHAVTISGALQALSYGGITEANLLDKSAAETIGGAWDLGTPSAAVLTNATGLPISTGVSGLGANVATWLGTPSSANLFGAITDETGSGGGTPLAVFNFNPTLTGALFAGILADNDDMVFEIDADNDGSNKYSFTDGVSAEIMSLTEAGLLTISALTGTGVIDFGGATSFEIPQDKTTTVEGQITIDGTSGQLRYHGNSAQRTLSYLNPFSKTIENLAAADDDVPFGSATYARTITKVGCRCIGTCTTKAEISLEDSTGNAMTHTTPTCATTGAITFQSITAGGALVAGEGMRFDVDNAVSPETDWYEITWEETITAD